MLIILRIRFPHRVTQDVIGDAFKTYPFPLIDTFRLGELYRGSFKEMVTMASRSNILDANEQKYGIEKLPKTG